MNKSKKIFAINVNLDFLGNTGLDQWFDSYVMINAVESPSSDRDQPLVLLPSQLLGIVYRYYNSRQLPAVSSGQV